MLECLRHRGPDDEGVYADGAANLGMTRLSIIDLAGGHQPIANEDDTVWAVFNGEIYNYVELRKELEDKGHRFRTSSDTETIVHGFEEYGVEFAHRLNGMFSIAIWDTRTQTLLLYRDRFGVKPLFYASLPDGVVFASEIKAVLWHPRVGTELDFAALSHFFALRNIPAPHTVYRHVRALLPGNMLTWNQERGAEVSRWYELPTATTWNDEDEDELVERIDDVLRDSVRVRLRSDVRSGAYLSGGIDSSTIVAIMSGYSHAPVKTFTLGFADSPQDKRDLHFARSVAERYATEHHECMMSWRDLRDELPAIVRHLDQPFAGVLSSFWLSRFMQQHVTVALSGDGADELFGSYAHHRLVWPIAAVRRAREEGHSPSDIHLGSFAGRGDLVAELSQHPPWVWRLRYGAFTEQEKQTLLSERGRELFGPYSTSAFLKEFYGNCDAPADDLNKMLYLDTQTLLPNEVLYFNDMLSMAHSMEVRTPFLDVRLVELAFSIPGSLKIRDGQLKYVLRRVAARYVPPEILERPKEGFVLPNNTWLRGAMSGLLEEVLSPERLELHGFVSADHVRSLTAAFLRGDDALTFRLWTLIVFQLWYEVSIAQ